MGATSHRVSGLGRHFRRTGLSADRDRLAGRDPAAMARATSDVAVSDSRCSARGSLAARNAGRVSMPPAPITSPRSAPVARKSCHRMSTGIKDQRIHIRLQQRHTPATAPAAAAAASGVCSAASSQPRPAPITAAPTAPITAPCRKNIATISRFTAPIVTSMAMTFTSICDHQHQ